MGGATVPARRHRRHPMPGPHFACSLSVQTDSKRAEREALESLDVELGGEAADLVVAFATHHHGAALEELGPRLSRRTGASVVLGCTAESVIGGCREIEGQPGLALWAARLPGTRLRFFDSQACAGADGEPKFTGTPQVERPEEASMILVADPFTFPVDPFLTRLNEDLPGVPAMGGMASGGMGPGQSLLFTADGIREAGAVGVVLEGGVRLHAVVSQGCRPIGQPWVVTACHRNWIQKLGGRPALEVLMETWHGLCPDDQRLLQSAPFIGLAIDPSRSRFERGDFLVRGIMSVHQNDRAFAVADFVRRGQTVQLLVRDAVSAGEDLRHLMECRGGGALTRDHDRHRAGALIFSCNGRGSRMFERPDHDIGCVRAGLEADVPIAGFFAAGEIGPVGGRNFLHGFTASVAVFRQSSAGA